MDAYLADPDTATTNRLIAQAYKEGLTSGTLIQPTSLPHYVPGRKDMFLYKNGPWVRRESDGKTKADEKEEHVQPLTKL